MIKNKIFEIIGWFILIIGLLGLFLPILNGLLLITLGLFIVSRFNPKTKNSLTKFLKKLEEKFPKIKKTLKFIRKIFNPKSNNFDYEQKL